MGSIPTGGSILTMIYYKLQEKYSNSLGNLELILRNPDKLQEYTKSTFLPIAYEINNALLELIHENEHYKFDLIEQDKQIQECCDLVESTTKLVENYTLKP